MKASNKIQEYGKVRLACEQRGNPVYKSYNNPAPTFGGVPAPSHTNPSNSYRPAAPANGYGGYNNAGPSRAGGTNWQTSYNRPPPTLQEWKPNPMWKPVRALTSMEMLPDISHNENSHVRRERKTNFTIPSDIMDKLNYSRDHPNSHPRHAIRLFCTSSDYYKPPGMPLIAGQPIPTNRSIPIEFPSNPDIMVDSYPLPFKEKGLRGKAGSAPPFDLEKGQHGLSRVPGRMITITMGHTGPTVGKKKDVAKRFFYQIVYAEMTTKGELLSRLKGLVPTSVESSLAEFKKRQEEDDDIVVGTSVMSLKDPLAYMRMTRPVRSSRCTHIQCFDAQWWIESNALHPQWHCPHCGKELQFPELIVDGYVMSILDACPDSVDDVVLEPSGDWHTEDNKYGSADWLKSHGVAAPPPVDTKPDIATPPISNGTGGDNAGPKRKIVELLSDSEDEGEQPLSKTTNGVSRPPVLAISSRPTPAATPVTAGPSSGRSSIQSANEIIDLTLSDSDEDDNDDDETEPPSASQQYFREPGASYTNRNAADSFIPQHLQNREMAARPTQGDWGKQPQTFPEPAPPSAPISSDRLLSPSVNGQGSAARGGGTWINPLESEWASRYGPRPPTAPRSTLGGSFGGAGGGTDSSGSLSKRPRMDWLEDNRAPPVDPPRALHHAQQSPNPSSIKRVFAAYAGTSASGLQGPAERLNNPNTHRYLAPRPTSSQAYSSPIPSPTLSVNQGQQASSASSPVIPTALKFTHPPPLRIPNQRDRPGLESGPSTAAMKSPSLKVTIPNPNFRGERSRPSTPLNPARAQNRIDIGPSSTTQGPRQDGGDTDEASLELNIADRSSASPAIPVNLPIHAKFTAQNRTPNTNTNTGTSAPRVNNRQNHDEDAGDRAERSSDLGLGMDTLEENFWEGVLNGDIDI
nr:uncharacterized protein I303_01410 [Kwoniella dejecticola CBS 10117]OBR89581.1 hypothetical protein I303_01410 [Kwoniella dejecticola CBS 10117]